MKCLAERGFLTGLLARFPRRCVLSIIIFAILLSLNSETGFAQDISASVLAGRQSLRFSRLSVDDGLCQDDVRAMVQDRHGFMWFGTAFGGLSRYDGYEFKTFRHDVRDPHSLSFNFVWFLYVDHAGTLWVGTDGGGLDRFDCETERFIHHQHDENNENTLPSNSVLSIVEDQYGTLWVGTRAGLSRFNREDGTFFTFPPNPDGGGLLHASVRYLFADPATGLLWVCTSRGINIFDPCTEEFLQSIHARSNDPTSISNASVNYIFKDRSGIFWMCTEGGLNSYNLETGQFTRYLHDPDDPDSLINNRVGNAYEDIKGNLWVSTRGGLELMDRQHGTFTHFQNDPANPYSISDNFVYRLYGDRGGGIWISTTNRGINHLVIKDKGFVSVRANPGEPDSISHEYVLAICVDSRDRLWIGTFEGLNCFEGKTNTRYYHDPDDPDSLSSDNIRAIVEDSHGNIWVGTRQNGLNCYNGEKFIRYPHDPAAMNQPGGLSGLEINSLLTDDKGGVWVGVRGRGLDYFDGQRFIAYQPKPDDSNSLTTIWPHVGAIDQQGNIWMGSNDRGLTRLDPETGVFTNYLLEEPSDSEINKFLYEVYIDRDGIIWTGGLSGLHRFDPVTETFTDSYTQADGLPADAVLGIEQDADGCLWIGTSKGLSRFDIHQKTFRNYDKTDGLPGNQFLMHSSAKGPGNQLFFGGNRGFVAFHPDRLTDNTNIPPVVLTGFELFDRAVAIGAEDSPLKQTVYMTDAITLRYDQSVISFKFSALDYTAPMKNQYRYQLEGFDADWRTVDAGRRFATYTHMLPGNYLFRVQGSNNDGYWNESGVALSIMITPPWWKAVWFRAGLFIAIPAVAFSGYGLRIRSLHRRSRMLEEQVSQRTQQLRVAKDKAEVASRTKSVFLANMSHELRTPLNGILGYTQILRQHVTDSENNKRIDVIHRSGEHLLSLINDVLDISKIEAGKMTLRQADTHLRNLLQHVAEIIHSRAAAKWLRFRFEIDPAVPVWVCIDKTRLRQVLLNLLGNAVKFTDCGQVTLQVSCVDTSEVIHDKSNRQHVTIRFDIQDTGVGIEPEKLEKIFQMFEQLGDADRRAEGTGLGLAISRQLVDLMNSQLHVESQPGSGSRFWFDLVMPTLEKEADEIDERLTTGLVVGYKGPRRTILVVDDIPSNRQVVEEMLIPLGFSVIQAENGQVSVLCAKEVAPDLILMDERMPVMSGVEATRQIRQIPDLQKIPIIAMSASVSIDEQANSLKMGYNAFLPKPVYRHELLEILRIQLDLQWDYVYDTHRHHDRDIEMPVVPPDPEILQQLRELVRAGDMYALQERAQDIKSMGKQYHAFADLLDELSQGFQEKQLSMFLERYDREFK